ncbi:MAG: hypothetical protein H6Q05_2029 [Acidobacteria bacterium]|nr:hypothetical protein [Acidobacteriota bacterium]
MQPSSNPLVLVVSAILFSAVMAEARQGQTPSPATVAAAVQSKTEGILTDRLAEGHLSIWKSITAVVFAKDKTGQLKHPRLFALWEKVDTNGHVVFVELVSQQGAYGGPAGKFRIETLDPGGKRHISSIRLNLPTIERAAVDEGERRDDGCLPFAGLGNKERYAEVLGHELAHAATILGDREFLRLYQDLEREAGEYHCCLASPDRRVDELEMRLAKIQHLTREFERPARSAELEIWRELLNGRGRIGNIQKIAVRLPRQN